MSKSLPSMAPYPEAIWRADLQPQEWNVCLDAWIAIAEAHLSRSQPEFEQSSCRDESVWTFLTSYMGQVAISKDHASAEDVQRTKTLRRCVYFLTSRLLETKPAPVLLSWRFMSDFSKVYGKMHASRVISLSWQKNSPAIEKSLASLKTQLIGELDAGLKGAPGALEAQLKRLNHFLHASPDAAAFLMTGSDFTDGLVSCYKLMNPPLRSAILSTTYLCLIALTEGSKPRLALLTEQLYSLKAAADSHKAGPLNERESLVAELVTTTPILRQLQLKINPDEPSSNRVKVIVTALETFKKGPGDGKGGSIRPKHLIKRKLDKGKSKQTQTHDFANNATDEIHIHKMSLISQIKDLFPDLGEGFVAKLLSAYEENIETVIAHLLEDSLPPHLAQADRSEPLQPPQTQPPHQFLAPHPSPPLPTRRNIHDNDAFDNLSIAPSQLHFGKRNPTSTASTLLSDRTTAPSTSRILSALAAFDSDDDERDDTYDVADVGGTIDSATPGGQRGEGITSSTEQEANAHEEALFRAWKSDPRTFDRDSATRRGVARGALKTQTGMSDEAIEGWAIMLSRDPRRLKRLEAKLERFTGQQTQLAGSRWQNGTDTEDSGAEGVGAEGVGAEGAGSRGGFRGRGRGRGRGGARGGGNVAGPTGDAGTEKARSNKEANKGSRANHNRRDQRARKMARGGFAG